MMVTNIDLKVANKQGYPKVTKETGINIMPGEVNAIYALELVKAGADLCMGHYDAECPMLSKDQKGRNHSCALWEESPMEEEGPFQDGTYAGRRHEECKKAFPNGIFFSSSLTIG